MDFETEARAQRALCRAHFNVEAKSSKPIENAYTRASLGQKRTQITQQNTQQPSY